MIPNTSVSPAASRNSSSPNCKPLRHCSRKRSIGGANHLAFLHLPCRGRSASEAKAGGGLLTPLKFHGKRVQRAPPRIAFGDPTLPLQGRVKSAHHFIG